MAADDPGGRSRSSLREFVLSRTSHEILEVEALERRFRQLDRWQIVGELKQLESEGTGRFVVGRRSKPSRFLVGDASGGSSREESEDADADADEGHVFIYRRRPLMSVSLPADLTRREAERLQRWIATLPEEGGDAPDEG